MLSYETIQPGDERVMTEMYERYLNAGPAVAAYIREGFDTGGCLGVKCVLDGELIGVFTARSGIQFTCGHEDIAERIAGRFPARVVTGDMLVVLPEYRSQGIARRLTELLRRQLLDTGAEYFVAEMWIRSIEHDIPARGSVNHLGCVVFEEVHPLFYAGLGLQGLTCPECGERCVCSALVRVMRLGQNGPAPRCQERRTVQ